MFETILRSISLLIFNIKGWKLGPAPTVNKGIIIVVGHTSNWDFPLGLTYGTKHSIDIGYTIKKEWIKFPFKGFFMDTGAIPIKRKFQPGEQKIDYITQMANSFKSKEKFYITITPEATRSPNANWKTGFYRLAKKTNLPIILGYIDYAKKEVGCRPEVVYPKETLEETLAEIVAFYKTVTPRYPEKVQYPL